MGPLPYDLDKAVNLSRNVTLRYWTQYFESCEAYNNRNVIFVLDYEQCLFIQQYNDVTLNITTTNTLFVFAII
jgi:hypothetical protein